MNRLLVGRIFLVIGLTIGLIAWWTTFVHIGDPNYVLIDAFAGSKHHPWHHNFREVIGDLAAMAVFLLIFFGEARYRTKETWNITFILMTGYYAAFWVGTPFLPELASDTWTSELVHIGMAAFSIAGLLIAKSEFCNSA